jgi:hypothetical protein
MNLEIEKRAASAFLNSEEEVAAWLKHQEELDTILRKPTPGFGLRGTMHAVLRKADGRIFVSRKDNGIVNAGFDFISNSIGNRAASGATAAMGWIAIGTGTTAFSASQTALITELVRQAATYGHTAGTKSFQFSTTFAAGVGTGTIAEAGVFNLSTLGGTMLDRVVFAGISKAAGDTLTQTFTFTMT